jgi:Cu(I)/Ag(I) efflux system membrane protein CusA/SilA
VIAVAFLPIFTLVDQEGRLFRPLAWTKNLAMFIAAGLALTLDPALRMLFARMDWLHFRPRWASWIVNQVTVGRYYPEEKHPISTLLFRVYEPVCRLVLRHPRATIAAAVLIVATTVPSTCAWATSSCRPSTREPCSTCPRRCLASRSARPAACCRRRTES